MSGAADLTARLAAVSLDDGPCLSGCLGACF